MKKVVGKFVLAFFMFVVLLSLTSAVEFGTCGIVLSTECDDIINEGHIIIGLSSSTNAHAQFPYTNYPYVLCCNLGTGNKNCTEGLGNKILAISSATNAHAEVPFVTSYTTNICYESLSCIHSRRLCGTDTATEFPLGIVSLSLLTNAHIGPFEGEGSYLNKICCKGESLNPPCTIKSASWDVEGAISGQNVHLQVVGSGAMCIGQTILLNVSGGSEKITTQPIPIMFTDTSVIGSWTAEYQKCGIWPFETDCDYYFEASLETNPLQKVKSSEPDLSISERSAEECVEVTSCVDYKNKLDCNSDATICNVSKNSDPDIACDSDSFYCGCVWDENATDTEEDPKCKFSYTEITEESCGSPIKGEGCGFGCTLCTNVSTGNYCNIGSSCPSGIKPTNNNGSCDFGIDSCGSADCSNGNQDSCEDGTYCVSDKCGNVIGPPLTLGSCKITQQVTKGCEEEPVGYKMVTLTTEWTGEASGTQYENCIAKNNQDVRISCPAQVQLPFFDTIGIVLAILAIILIYIVVVLRKKSKHKKK